MDKIKTIGGARKGAGRKEGSGQFKEPTTVMRVPVSQKATVSDFLAAYAKKMHLKTNLDTVAEIELPALDLQSIAVPLFNSKVPAGFPSPADDHIEKRLDTNEFLIDQEDATFFITIIGESMLDVGLFPGDKAVVDRSKLPNIGDIILAIVDGEFTVKILGRKQDGRPQLLPANASGKYQAIDITENMHVEVWGVVTGSFRRFK